MEIYFLFIEIQEKSLQNIRKQRFSQYTVLFSYTKVDQVLRRWKQDALFTTLKGWREEVRNI